MINQERRSNGLPALSMDSRLVTSAHYHNLWMAHYNTMSHQVPGEPWLGTRINNAGYTYGWAGENVAWTTDESVGGADALEQGMYDEQPPNDGHRQNILNTHYTNVGVDAIIDPVNGKLWLTCDFGSPG